LPTGFYVDGGVKARWRMNPRVTCLAELQAVLIQRVHVLAVKLSFMRKLEVGTNLSQVEFDMIPLGNLVNPIQITIAL